MVFFVTPPVTRPLFFPIGCGWNDHLDMPLVEPSQKSLRVIPLVHQTGLGGHPFHQRNGLRDVGLLPAHQDKLDRQSEGIHDRVNLATSAC